MKRILVIGSSSYASQGLVDRLIEEGHFVVTFNRGQISRTDMSITGSVLELSSHPHLDERFDVLINYTILRGCSIEENMAYMDELLKLCRRCEVERLIHISSFCVYSDSVSQVVDESEVEQDPLNKGVYGSLKVAQELCLRNRDDRRLQVASIRAGVIVGQGMTNPIGGMGIRVGRSFVLQLGSGGNIVPLTTRTLLNKVVSRLVSFDLYDHDIVVLLVDTNSPSRRQWLVEYCRKAGISKGVVALPKAIWRCLGFGSKALAPLLRMNTQSISSVVNMCMEKTYDASLSESLLQMSFACDWREELRKVIDSKTIG